MNTLPEYDEENNECHVTIEDNIIDSDIQSVFTIFANAPLSYPYTITKGTGICKSFNEVLEVLDDNWESFRIDGFEEYYSPSEVKLIRAVINRYSKLYKY